MLSSFSIWDWSQIIGTAMVLIGVCGEFLLEFKNFPYNPTGFEVLASGKRRIEIISLVILLLGLLLEVVALPHSLVESAGLKKEADDAKLLAADTQSNNLVLSIELEKLKNPSIITAEQREKFIEILCGPLNASKVPIIVIYAGNDRPTEQFAFQIRNILDEAGYGFTPSKYQASIILIPAGAVCVTDAVPHIDLPAFTWMDATLVKLKSGSVSPLPESSNPVVEHPGDILHTEQPFTDREPNVIALFSGAIPPKNTMPSVNVAYPASDNPNRGFHYIYSQTKDTNAILYGVCEIFHDIGITIGENKATGIIPDGYVGFFIPSQ
jgi:hypothetical protein